MKLPTRMDCGPPVAGLANLESGEAHRSRSIVVQHQGKDHIVVKRCVINFGVVLHHLNRGELEVRTQAWPLQCPAHYIGAKSQQDTNDA